MDRIDVDKPLWDQRTFYGRFRHFAYVTDPLLNFCSKNELLDAKKLVEKYRRRAEPSDTTREMIIRAKKLHDSAFHPDSGELQNIFGRMSFQLPGGMLTTGAMLQWYRTNTAVVFWQWVNQSFNALVNYTNRNAKLPISKTQLFVAYVSATSCALVTALYSKAVFTKRANPLIQRYVPFIAVAAANCVNIPLVRQLEILNGIEVSDENGKTVGKSRVAAVKGISQVVFSRIFMCSPGMLILPIIMERLEKEPFMKQMPAMHGPMQIMFVGVFLLFMVPAACGLFPQRCSLKTSTMSWLEPKFYEEMKKKNRGNVPDKVYFNKGL